jgi:hypothetical protein
VDAVKHLRRPAWFVGAIAGAILIAIWFYAGVLDNAYVNRPRHAEAHAGWTTPYEVKGITVYISGREKTVLAWLVRLEIALLIVVLICGWAGLRQTNSNEKGPL